MKTTTIAVLLAALFSGTSVYAQTAPWKITEIKGSVQISSRGVQHIATGVTQISTGDIVSTGRDGRAVLTHGQDFVLVSPNSRMRIAEPEADGLTKIFEDLGSVVFKIEKKSAPHFAVQTPYLAAVVKGTTFSVNVSEAGASVQVVEGAVQVSTLDGAASQLVTPGMIGMVTGQQLQQLIVDTGGTRSTQGASTPSATGTATDMPAADATVTEPAASANVDVAVVASPPSIAAPPPELRIAAVNETPVSLSQVRAV